MNVDFPDKLQFLFEPWRYKILFGGRGGAKSWGIARALLLLGAMRPLRILCGREIQKTLADSVHLLLKDQIVAMDLEHHYRVYETEIVGKNESRFSFVGLRHNPKGIKSFEGADIFWGEEAQTFSEESLDILIPTIRKEGSELWFSMNPALETDPAYKRLVLNPPPGSKVVNVNYWDNPWLPETLRIEAEHLKATDPKAYQHIWEGKTVSALSGAIYAAEIAEAEKQGRIGNVPRDRTRPVDTYWDLGFGDATAIWFAQTMPDGSIRVIDYLESSGHTIEWYLIQLQNKGYLYGTDWLPHDAVDAIIHKRLAGNDPGVSIEMLFRKAGRKVRIAAKMLVATGINAVRTIFSVCWFDLNNCREGIQALRHYQWAPATAIEATPDPREGKPSGSPGRIPLHNWASHGSDAYRTLAFGAKLGGQQQSAPPPPPPPPSSPHSWMS